MEVAEKIEKTYIKKGDTVSVLTGKEKGKTGKADKFDGDIRKECTNGIHFFMTEREAKEW